MLQADETLDFHNKQIADVALGNRCPNKQKISTYVLTSPLGHIYTNCCPKGLHCVKLYGDTSYDNINWDTKVDFFRKSTLVPNAHAMVLKKWLAMYFSNPLKCQDIEISFCGLEDYGEFNSKIWMTILETCPAGEMMSYSELAQRSGYNAGASKVVGYAINKNPYMLVVGDHRVVKASGEIWCENESQRNKLRRLLVKYEISFTPDSLDEALLKVKERNESSKGTRKRNTSAKMTKTNAAAKTKGRGVKKESTATAGKKKAAKKGRRKKDETSDEDSPLEEDEDFIDDDEDDD